MRKIQVILLGCISMWLSLTAYAAVGPGVYLSFFSDNQTLFQWNQDLIFMSDQDIYAYYNGRNIIKVEFLENTTSYLYLTYRNQIGYDEPQCKLTFKNKNGFIDVQQEAVSDSFINCELTGDFKDNNLVIHLSMK